MNMVAKILFEARSKTVKRATDLKESAEMHRNIYRAIRERNPEAASQTMGDHLLLAQKAQAQESIKDFTNGSGKTDGNTRETKKQNKISRDGMD